MGMYDRLYIKILPSPYDNIRIIYRFLVNCLMSMLMNQPDQMHQHRIRGFLTIHISIFKQTVERC